MQTARDVVEDDGKGLTCTLRHVPRKVVVEPADRRETEVGRERARTCRGGR